MSFVAQDPIEARYRDPRVAFAEWWNEVQASGRHEPTAVALSTASADGMPSSRMVLLKGHDAEGFVFYTNYGSQKSRELTENPRASMLFYWGELGRQVRISGTVQRVSAAESDAYFASRPRGSQLGAHASPQSDQIPDRDFLAARMAALETEYQGKPVPRPPHWGGFRLVPESFEFWQGQVNRLHDRLRYVRSGRAWSITRLAP